MCTSSHKHQHDIYLFSIIDMDQSKSNLPYSSVLSKSASTLWRLRTHITGVLVHTKAPQGKLAYVFVDMLQWPHGSSLTITVLIKTLYEYQKDHVLPPNLYIQMDNTCRYVRKDNELIYSIVFNYEIYYEI